MIYKRIMALVLTFAMLCSCMVFAADAPMPDTAATSSVTTPVTETQQLTQEEINKNATGFKDIAPDAPYAEAVKKLVSFGIINGYEDGTFKPEGEVTRAEMCKMINLTLGYTDFEGAAGFPDVQTTNWYYAYALAAQKAGYVEGYDDKTFRGSNNITRQEVCAILNRLLKPMDLPIPVTITDTVSNWARPHVEIIVKNFIMPLEENNTFRATENLKRHELATVLANMAIGPVNKIEADVRFFVNGEQYGETQTVEVGTTAVEPEEPKSQNEDEVFVGWRQIGTVDVVEAGSMIVVSDIDYEAVFAKVTHTVTLYSRGAVYETMVVNHGSTIAPKNPEVKGYEFMGWSLTENGELIKLSTTKIDKDMNLYAVFEKESGGEGGGGAAPEETSYKVKFYVFGDEYVTQKIAKNGSPKMPSEPEVEGYSFVGWSLDVDGEIVNPTTYKITKSITFYAVFEQEVVEPEVFTVTFYVDGEKYDTQYVTDGESPEQVSNPSKDGYIFKHWSKSEGGSKVELGYVKITSDTKFYAVFEEEEEEINYFTVTFMVDGSEYSSSKVQEGNKVSAPATPSKSGYSFKGWSRTDGGSVTSVSIAVTEDIVFYAVFEKIEFTVTFYVDSDVYNTQKVGLNETAFAPSNPSKDGYTFKGWSESEDGEIVNVGSVEITYNTQFYAIFEQKKQEKKSFTITFVVDGKTYDSKEVVEGDSFSIPADPKKLDYEFVGWSKSNGGSVVSVVTTPTSNATYYAVFEEIKKHTVIFYVEDTVYKKLTVVDGDTASAPSNPAVDGYTFKGWSLSKGGSTVSVGSVKITSDTNFYAVLEEKAPEKKYFTVTFISDGQTYDSQQVAENDTPEEPKEPAKDGYTFVGWAKSSAGAVVDVTTVKITARTSFYAIFEEDEPDPVYYTVTFYVDGEKYDSQRVLSGDYPDLPKDPSLDGYEFLGWAKSEGGNTVNPDSTSVKADVDYYAVFEEIKEEVKYHKIVFWFDGEFYKSYDVADGDTISPPSIPKLEESATFLGWALSDSAGEDDVVDVEDIVIDGPMDFYSVIINNPNDAEFMEKLQRGYKQLGRIRATGFAKDAISIITSCISMVLDDANSGVLITKKYVTSHYSNEVGDVADIINNKMDSSQRSSFIGLVTDTKRIDKDVQDFLIDYFDIDTNI